VTLANGKVLDDLPPSARRRGPVNVPEVH
jgi:hypothetical protein